MGLVTEQASKKDHTYVMLNQDNTQDDELQAKADDSTITIDDEIDLKDFETNKVTLNSSEESIGHDTKPQNTTLIPDSEHKIAMKLLSALAYAVCSFMITVINKIVLTSYNFPSANILGLGQMIAILIILKLGSLFRLVTIRRISLRNRKLWILATIYIGNLITGLGSTKRLPLPMFIALRRISIAMTAIGEFYILHVKQPFSIIISIITMIGGSFIAAASDLTFDAIGYILVMFGNLFTAANVVYIRKTIDSREINKNEILFYSALLTILPNAIICMITNDPKVIYNFEHWNQVGFVISFLSSCIMGYLLMLSTIVCTQYNSPLTTAIVGTLKVNIL